MTDTHTDTNIDINTDVDVEDNTDIDVNANTPTDAEADAETAVAPIYRILDLHESERPRERLAKLGPQVLTNAELIAILLHVGVTGESAVQVGQRLLNKFRGLQGLHRAPIEELMEQHGLGEAKAAQIKAAIELGRRLTLESPEERPAINSPADAAALVQYEMSALEQEHLRVMLLDRRNRVLETVEVYKGSVNSSQVRVGELFKEAVRKNASAIIVIHNHPSGCAKKHVSRKFQAEPCTECAEWLEEQGR